MYIIRVIVLFFLGVPLLNAQIVTDRPDQTESPLPVGKRNLQIEVGMQSEVRDTRHGSYRTYLHPTSLIRYGISDRVELRFVNTYMTVDYHSFKETAFENFEIGTKIGLFDRPESTTDIGFIGHLSVPSGTESFTDNDYGFIGRFCFSHDLSESFNISYNLGGDYFNDNFEFAYTLAFGFAVNDKVGIYFEPYGYFGGDDSSNLLGDMGVTYLFTPDFQFDFSYGLGITERSNYIAIGGSWLFKSVLD